MENTVAFVTWDQMIQLGILLIALLTLIYMIFHNHTKK